MEWDPPQGSLFVAYVIATVTVTVIVRDIVIDIAIFLGQFCSRVKGAMRLTLCEAPTRKTRPDHNNGNALPYSFTISVWVF